MINRVMLAGHIFCYERTNNGWRGWFADYESCTISGPTLNDVFDNAESLLT